jgi:hypothetical protein
MATAKDLIVKPITQKAAAELVKRVHYSGKIVNNSQLHFGVFIDDILDGVMSFGASMDKRKTQALVADTRFNDFLELNRMAFGERLPRNSESRALSVAMRLIKKHYPHIKWVISFADGCQCGDGTIYRASGFYLSAVKKNKTILRLADGSIVANKTLSNPNHVGADGKFGAAVAKANGAKPLDGYMLRYIYFLDPSFKSKIREPLLDFSVIAELNAGMYKGVKLARRSKQAMGGDQPPQRRCDSDLNAPIIEAAT